MLGQRQCWRSERVVMSFKSLNGFDGINHQIAINNQIDEDIGSNPNKTVGACIGSEIRH